MELTSLQFNYAPSFLITANGVDITAKINDALIDLTINDQSGGESDTLTLRLDGTKVGKLPPMDAILRVSLGFNGAYYPQGAFTVDGMACSGFPEVVTINATAAPLGGVNAKSSLQSQRTQSWAEVTLEDILKVVASRNNLTPLIAESLRSTIIKHIDQTSESDLAFVTRLARQYGAVSKVSNENWMFLLEGAGTNASGTKVLPIRPVYAGQCKSYSYNTKTRTKLSSAVAKWHNKETGKKGTVREGTGDPAFQIVYVYPNEDEAKAAVKARANSVKSGSETFTCSMAADQGLLQAFAEGHIQPVGFRDEISSKLWRLKKLTKMLSKSGGMTISFECDLGAKDNEN